MNPHSAARCRTALVLAISAASAACFLALCVSLSAYSATRAVHEAPAAIRATEATHHALPSQQRAAGPGRAMLLASPFAPRGVPAGQPQDPALHTRIGLYSTRLEASQLEREQDGDSAWAVLDGCDAAALNRTAGGLHGLMAANDLAGDAPVFVPIEAACPRAATALIDRLAAEALTRVYLVTD